LPVVIAGTALFGPRCVGGRGPIHAIRSASSWRKASLLTGRPPSRSSWRTIFSSFGLLKGCCMAWPYFMNIHRPIEQPPISSEVSLESSTASEGRRSRPIADEVDGSRSRHRSATVGWLSGNPSDGAIHHADYHSRPRSGQARVPGSWR
jgi:hypothetical protein